MIIVVIPAIFAIIIILISMNNNKKVELLIKQEPAFKFAKSFDGAMGKLLIAESGHIGFISTIEDEPRIIHINDINGFEIVTNEKNRFNFGATMGGDLLFGGVGALIGALRMKGDVITSICLDFKLNDWDKPSFQFYLLINNTKSNGFVAKQMIQTAGKICTLLEELEIKHNDTVRLPYILQ